MTRRQGLLGANRDFTLLWVGQAISALGGAATTMAMPLLVLHISGSAAAVGILTAISMILSLALMLPAGAWVDRVNKWLLMMASNAALCITQLALALFVLTDQANVAVIVIFGALAAPFRVLMGTAEEPAIRHVVASSQLPLALSRNEARNAAVGLLGPPLGGLMFAVSPALPLIVDAVSFLVAMLCISLIRTPMPATAGARDTRFVTSIAAGLKLLWRQAFLRITLVLIAGLNLVSNALWIAAIVIAERAGHASTSGLILAFGGIGSLVGALIAPRIVARLTVRTILIANRLIWAAVIPLFVTFEHPTMLGVLFGLLFLTGPTGNAAVTARRMALTPTDLQGRANSAVGFVTGITAPMGVACIGFAIDRTGITASILALAAIMLGGAIIATLNSAIRTDGAAPATGRTHS